MARDWSNDRYVRLFKPSVDHRTLCWQARVIWPLLMQEANGAGVLRARKGIAAIANAIDVPLEVVEPGVADLLADGCLEVMPDGYIIRNYVAAQTAIMSSNSRKARQREVDEAVAALAAAAELAKQASSQIGHGASRPVTPSRAEPNREEELSHRARGRDAVVALAERLPTAHAVAARKLADSIPACRTVSVGGGLLAGQDLARLVDVAAAWTREATAAGEDPQAFADATLAKLVAVRSATSQRVQHVRYWVPSTFWDLDGIAKDLAQTPQQAAASARASPGQPRASPRPTPNDRVNQQLERVARLREQEAKEAPPP